MIMVLGLTTRTLLVQQLLALQGLSLVHLPRELPFLHLAKQMTLLNDNGFRVTNLPQHLLDYESDIVHTLRKIPHNTLSHLHHPIPPQIYAPLLQLGIHTLQHLTEHEDTHMIDTKVLKFKFGSKVKDFHKRALNKLTVFLNQINPSSDDITACDTKPLSRDKRFINRAYLTAELRTRTLNPASQAGISLRQTILEQCTKKSSESSTINIPIPTPSPSHWAHPHANIDCASDIQYFLSMSRDPRFAHKLPSSPSSQTFKEPLPPEPFSSDLFPFIHFNTSPCNPDRDILPTHTYQLCHYRTNEDKLQNYSYHCHDPHGRHIGSLPDDRLQFLFQR